MNARQNAKNSMYQSALLVLLENSAVYALLLTLVAAVGKLELFYNELKALVDKQQKILSGYAADKYNKRVAMVQLAIKIKGAVQAMAEDDNNEVLFNSVDFEESVLLTQRASYARSHCQIIFNEANAVAVGLVAYGISAADLTALQTAVTAFGAVMSMPKAKIAELKTSTTAISKKMKEIDDLLKKKIDKQMLIYKADATTYMFWQDYMNARIIYDPATSYTEVQATIVNANTNLPLPNVKMTVKNGPDVFEELSNSKGIADRKPIHPEITDLVFEFPGFETVMTSIDPSPGEKEKIVVKMKPL